MRVAHAPGMPGTFARHWLKRKSIFSDPGMHHGTCITHVPCCMSGSLTRDGGENVPGIPGACATRNITYLARGPWLLMTWRSKESGHQQPCHGPSSPEIWLLQHLKVNTYLTNILRYYFILCKRKVQIVALYKWIRYYATTRWPTKCYSIEASYHIVNNVNIIFGTAYYEHIYW